MSEGTGTLFPALYQEGARVSSHEIAKTYYCKTPGCTNEARSPVGRYSYCDEHQGTAVKKPTAVRVAANGSTSGTEQALRNLLTLAKAVDKAKAKAEKLQGAANAETRKAYDLEAEYRDALAAAARGGSA